VEPAGILGAAEALGVIGPVLERRELGLRVRVVVRDVGPRVRLGDAEVREQHRHRLGLHRRAAVGVDGELPGLNALPLARLADELLGERGRLDVGDEPPDDVAAEHVEDDVEAARDDLAALLRSEAGEAR